MTKMNLAERDRQFRRRRLFDAFLNATMVISALSLALMNDDPLMSGLLVAGGAVAAFGSGAAFATRHVLTQHLAHTEELAAVVEPSQRPALLARLNEGAAAYPDLWQAATPIISLLAVGVTIVVALLQF